MRTAMLRAQVGKLCACLDVGGLEMLNAAEFVALSESPYPLVRWVAAEARLALSFARGAGEGFIEALTALDATTATFMRLGRGGLTADAGAVCDTSEHPERWLACWWQGSAAPATALTTTLPSGFQRAKPYRGALTAWRHTSCSCNQALQPPHLTCEVFG
jgi:hypothetical protein